MTFQNSKMARAIETLDYWLSEDGEVGENPRSVEFEMALNRCAADYSIQPDDLRDAWNERNKRLIAEIKMHSLVDELLAIDYTSGTD